MPKEPCLVCRFPHRNLLILYLTRRLRQIKLLVGWPSAMSELAEEIFAGVCHKHRPYLMVLTTYLRWVVVCTDEVPEAASLASIVDSGLACCEAYPRSATLEDCFYSDWSGPDALVPASRRQHCPFEWVCPEMREKVKENKRGKTDRDLILPYIAVFQKAIFEEGDKLGMNVIPKKKEESEYALKDLLSRM
jgi:hypothetical protein